MSREIDLAAIRAEVEQPGPMILRDGRRTVKVVSTIPWVAYVAFADRRLDDFCEAIAWEKKDVPRLKAFLFEGRPTLAEIQRRVDRIYSMGEAPASSRSSVNGSTRSRRTSNGSTGST